MDFYFFNEMKEIASSVLIFPRFLIFLWLKMKL